MGCTGDKERKKVKVFTYAQDRGVSEPENGQ